MQLVPNLMAALVAALAMAAAGDAEAAHLALVGGAVLGAVALYERRRAWTLGTGAVLAVAVAWVLPAGATRATVLVAVLAATLLAAAWQRLRATPDALPWEVAAPVACGVQLLARGDLLLPPLAALERAGILLELLGLPLAAAGAGVWLARRHGRFAALLAAALLAAQGPGFTAPTTATLVALAAGARALDRNERRSSRIAAAAVALAAIAWEQRAAGLGAAAAAALAGGLLGAAAATALGVAAALAVPLRATADLLREAAWTPLLMPVLFAVPRRLLVAAAALALGAAGAAPPGATAAAPVALLALSLPARSAAAGIAAVWSGYGLAVAVVMAAYPWLRPRPLTEALAWLGLDPGWPAALLVVALATLAALAVGALVWPRDWTVRVRVAALLAVAALCVALAAAMAPVGRALVTWPPLLQDASRPRFATTLDGAPVREVVLESRLAHAAALAAGTPVARLRLRDGGGGEAEWVVRAGLQTGEWAARRPDLAGRIAAPPAWRVWLEPQGFLGQTYRADWRLAAPLAARQVELERSPELPARVEWVVERLELRP